MQFNPRPIRLPNFIQKPLTPMQKMISGQGQYFQRMEAGACLAAMRSQQDRWLLYSRIELNIKHRSSEATAVITTVNFSAEDISNSVIQQGSQIINNINVYVCCETPQLRRLKTLLGKLEEQDNLTQTYKLYNQRIDSPSTNQSLTNSEKEDGIETLKAIFNHPSVSVPVEAIKGFLEAEAE
ncbi:hypothetical protein WJM97_10905 [Okeanomitos corallinicola TIOX110]|uniref:Uncharacterized protein n=1 Tax=Okeanomitos corallinicola TIOX110 TaxID=3133117 RepID=A0ABZ2UZ24_9CYAN